MGKETPNSNAWRWILSSFDPLFWMTSIHETHRTTFTALNKTTSFLFLLSEAPVLLRLDDQEVLGIFDEVFVLSKNPFFLVTTHHARVSDPSVQRNLYKFLVCFVSSVLHQIPPLLIILPPRGISDWI